MRKINANYLTSFPQETEKKLWFLDIYIYIIQIHDFPRPEDKYVLPFLSPVPADQI